jgi:hypothetical protein
MKANHALAPVRDAAGCPRRFAPRRPLNVALSL